MAVLAAVSRLLGRPGGLLEVNRRSRVYEPWELGDEPRAEEGSASDQFVRWRPVRKLRERLRGRAGGRPWRRMSEPRVSGSRGVEGERELFGPAKGEGKRPKSRSSWRAWKLLQGKKRRDRGEVGAWVRLVFLGKSSGRQEGRHRSRVGLAYEEEVGEKVGLACVEEEEDGAGGGLQARAERLQGKRWKKRKEKRKEGRRKKKTWAGKKRGGGQGQRSDEI
ncbi:hypothetical protein CRG98_038694 [Punica granatum]|uniref:Uncharacterized protein n=1 Tax=Punica granatum TaxID=22663 RepID=A0A2I0IAB6_PUNGR|nr:hypothetical protein CRG98_038694 [Punica granatum]